MEGLYKKQKREWEPPLFTVDHVPASQLFGNCPLAAEAFSGYITGRAGVIPDLLSLAMISYTDCLAILNDMLKITDNQATIKQIKIAKERLKKLNRQKKRMIHVSLNC